MASTAEYQSAETYLQALGKLLRDAPRDMGAELLEDVAQHIEEGRALGRRDEQILGALGAPETVAAPLTAQLKASRERAPLRRKSLVLGAVALILGVLVSIIDGSMADTLGDRIVGNQAPPIQGGYDSIYKFGALQLLIFAIFGLGVSASAVMKGRAALIYSYVIAGCMSILVAGFITSSGIFYIPSMVTAWMFVGIHRGTAGSVHRAGRVKRMRTIGGICLLLPVVFLVSGLFSGIEPSVAAYLYLALGLACGIGFLANFRPALWVTCTSGAALLVASVIDQGLLLAGIWLVGTVYFFFGLHGLLWFKRRAAQSR